MTISACPSWLIISFCSSKGQFFHFVQCSKETLHAGEGEAGTGAGSTRLLLFRGPVAVTVCAAGFSPGQRAKRAWAPFCSSVPGTAWRGRRAACEVQAEACGVIPVTLPVPLPRALRAHRSRRNGDVGPAAASLPPEPPTDTGTCHAGTSLRPSLEPEEGAAAGANGGCRDA